MGSTKMVPWKAREAVVDLGREDIFVLACGTASPNSKCAQYLKEGNITKVVVHIYIELVHTIGKSFN